MAEQETPKLHKERNKILAKYAEIFFGALDEINASLKEEKITEKACLLSAKSWVLRNKLYATIHDPYIYTLNEIENTDVFDDLDDEDQTAIDSLFDDEIPEKMVEVTILKSTTVNGKKLVKDTILEVTEENATKLVDDGKAKISEAEEPKKAK